MARPTIPISDADRRLVQCLSRWGVPVPGIAAELNLDPKSLRKHFSIEIADGLATARTDMRLRLWRKAVRGSISAIKLWLKINGGF